MTEPTASDYARAASVLWHFELRSIRPDGLVRGTTTRESEAADALRGTIVRIRTRDGDRWTLRDDLRRTWLTGVSVSELVRRRALYDGPLAPEQTVVDRWLLGPTPTLADEDVETLAVIARIGSWLDPRPPTFPSTTELDQRRAMAMVRASLVPLVGRQFHGRADELAELHRFVADDSGLPAILVVHGIGGVGKSTLSARLLLDVLDAAEAGLVAYLDFDAPTLDVGNGVTVMVELLRQAAAQRPKIAALGVLSTRASQATIDLAEGRGRAPGRAFAVSASVAELASSCGEVLRRAGVARITLVLDTFEDLQYASTDNVRYLVELIHDLHHRLPGLHTVVVSRTKLELPGAQYMEVGDLEEVAARALLADIGVDDDELASLAIRVARGNALSLHLAARMIRREGAAGLDGLESSLQQELVQGQLYVRILQHVHEADVQKLAHPGLVVRRVTPEIIQEVLAIPCGLGVIDGKRAGELFDLLGREASLVEMTPDGALQHRADVRRVMLRLLYQDRPSTTREIHTRAVQYYAARTGDIAIAEEAYHQFALGETEGPWLARMTPHAAQRLRSALDELPEASWTIIASYAGIDLPPERWDAAQVAERERRLAQRLREMMLKDRAEDALAELARTPPRGSSSMLWRWQGRALARVGRQPEALAALERALATLQGPADEATRDLVMARDLARSLGRKEVLVRLGEVSSDPLRTASAMRVEGDAMPLVASLRDERWLDDGDLRRVVQTAIAAPPRVSTPWMPDGSASTHAAGAYARAVKLNHRAADDSSGKHLLEWVDALAEEHADLGVVSQSLRDRVDVTKE